MIYLIYFKDNILIYLTYKAQMIMLVAEKVIILAKYLNYANIFSKKLAAELINCFNINKYIINLKSDK